jgi:hypothetical protein
MSCLSGVTNFWHPSYQFSALLKYGQVWCQKMGMWVPENGQPSAQGRLYGMFCCLQNFNSKLVNFCHDFIEKFIETYFLRFLTISSTCRHCHLFQKPFENAYIPFSLGSIPQRADLSTADGQVLLMMSQNVVHKEKSCD